MSDEVSNPDSTIRKMPAWASQERVYPSNSKIPQIIKILARGGMGTIYEAEQYLPQRRVAIKKIDDPHDRELQNSLIHEAMIMGALDHPNIIPVHRILLEKGDPSVVMKLVNGSTFKECLQKGYSAQESLHVMIQVCYAVEYAHEQDIIHRDIKPSNIMIGHFNEIYLLDWGIAIDLHQKEKAMDGFVGSPSFMAPEMLLGDPEKITKQTDVYLLGSTLHYALTGKRRYESDSFVELFKMIEEAEPVAYDGDIPKELGLLLNKACHKNPAERLQSVAEFKEALLDITQHWEVIQLTKEGLANSKKCIEATEVEEKETLFQRARQDFEYALRIWPNSISAKEGLRFIMHTMISFYISQKDHSAAKLLYEAFEEPDPYLEEKLDELSSELGLINKERRRLLEIGEANDFKKTQETSATFAMLIGFSCIFFVVAATVLQFYLQLEVAKELLLYSSIGLGLIIGFLMFSRRAFWMQNLAMERMVTAALGTVICVSLNRFVALYSSADTNSVIASDCFIIGLGTLMIAKTVYKGYLLPTFCVLAGFVATFVPILATPCLSLICLVVPFWNWWAWKRV